MSSNAKAYSSYLGGHIRKRNTHSFSRGIRYRADNLVLDKDMSSNDNEATPSGLVHDTASNDTLSSQSPSHGMTDIYVHDCHEGIPSISEVVAVIDEILDSMRAQRKRLHAMPHRESPTIFHHILPVCSVYIYFANNFTNIRA